MLFVQEHVIAYPPSPIDTNVTLFVQQFVLAYPQAPTDTNVTLFVREHDQNFPWFKQFIRCLQCHHQPINITISLLQ